jgi:hypothetical protein
MPDSVIKKVEAMGHATQPNPFNFLDRTEALFEWNDINETNNNIIEDDIVQYQLLVAEFSGINLDHNSITPSIKDDINPHGLAKDPAAQNANVAPYAMQEWINGPPAIHANNDKISKHYSEGNNIIAMVNIPPDNAHTHNPIIAIHDTNNKMITKEKSGEDSDSDNDNDDRLNPKKNKEEQEEEHKGRPGIRHLNAVLVGEHQNMPTMS